MSSSEQSDIEGRTPCEPEPIEKPDRRKTGGKRTEAQRAAWKRCLEARKKSLVQYKTEKAEQKAKRLEERRKMRKKVTRIVKQSKNLPLSEDENSPSEPEEPTPHVTRRKKPKRKPRVIYVSSSTESEAEEEPSPIVVKKPRRKPRPKPKLERQNATICESPEPQSPSIFFV